MTGPRVRVGLDRVCDGQVDLDHARRWALLTNAGATTASGEWSGDALRHAGYTLVLFLSPEHGLDGRADAGAAVPHGTRGEVLVMSLYGADLGPVERALDGVDGVIIDLPDAGCRYYTYPWTGRETLRMAGARSLPVVLLDRPNPLGGARIEGNLPDSGVDSPVCASRVPVRHGLTPGELARWNLEDRDIHADLQIISCGGWRREMLWPEIGLPWVPPSPALGSFAASQIYPGTCLLEGTTMSEGRGTEIPFEVVGSPGVDADRLASILADSALTAGAHFQPATFIPRASKWQGKPCHGVQITVADPSQFRPVATGLALVHALMNARGFAFRERFFDLLAGSHQWRATLQAGASPDEIVAGWQEDERRFSEKRRSILLYNA